MVSRCVRPMRSRRALLQEMLGKAAQIPADILSRLVDLACCGLPHSYRPANRYQDRSGFFFLLLPTLASADHPYK